MGKGSRWWCVLMGVFVIVVSGCSGGGGGGGDQADGEGDNLVTASSLSEFEGECTLVAIAGDPRVVNAEYDGQGRVSTSITLDGSSSYDPEGTKVTRYRWCLVGFEAPGSPVGSQTILNMGRFGSPVCTYTATETGRYTFELTVSNGKGRIGKDTLVVLVNEQGPPPLANAVLEDGLEDYEILSRYGKCYLARNRSHTPAEGDERFNYKQILYLEGSAYDRGFAEGYLCAEAVERMVFEFVYNFVRDFLGASPKQLPDYLIEPVRRVLVRAALSQEYAVPEEFIEEMQGIADGCQARGIDVIYDDLMLLNVGFDVLYSLVYQLGSLACNEVSIFGDGTLDGRLYHGRDFMFTTGGGVFSDESMIIVYKPTLGYAFAAASAPGFVGFPTGINSRGVSMAMDMVPNRLNRAFVSGMGTLLQCRNVVQFAGSFQDAIREVKNNSHAVSWLYQLSDGVTYEERLLGVQHEPVAMALETVADRLIPEGDDFIATLMGLLPGLDNILLAIDGLLEPDIIDSLGNTITGVGDMVIGLAELFPMLADLHPDRGVAVRTADYVDPEGLEDYRIVISGDDLLAHGTQQYTIVSMFPMQREDKDGLIGMSNHYILPQMNVTQMGLFYHTIDTMMGGGRESEWRYNTLLNPLLEDDLDFNGYPDEYALYGSVDARTAMYIIDFLNPGYGPRSGWFYGEFQDREVEGHHVLMDNTSLKLWSLHGYYDEPWMHVDLRWFFSSEDLKP
ncbi:MAG: hypothetical protein WAR22_09990 [Desulfomonilia bacterium]|jgi:hypothetical protein